MSEGIREYLGIIAEMHEKHGGAGLTSPARFMLEHGKAYKVGPDSFKGRRGRRGECYRNAGMQALGYGDLTYVEGYVTCHGVPLPHAWLTNDGETVIDPTLKADPKNKQQREYFGLAFKTAYLRKATYRDGVWGLLDFMGSTHKAIVHGTLDLAEALA